MHSIVVLLALALAGSAWGCNDSSAGPGPASLTGPTGPLAPGIAGPPLTGLVTAAGNPVGNVDVDVWWSCGPTCATGTEGRTDASGQYTIRRLPGAETVWAIAHKDGYVQQCVTTTTVSPQGSTTLDVKLTAIADLPSARAQSSPDSRTVSGSVFEITPAGRQPVDDASVSVYSDSLGDYAGPIAFTRTDATGHYVLCGLAPGPIAHQFAAKQGYDSASVPSARTTNAVVDIELRRR